MKKAIDNRSQQEYNVTRRKKIVNFVYLNNFVIKSFNF